MQIKQIHRKTEIKSDPVKVKEMMDKMRKEHSKMIKGKFEFVDAECGYFEFVYRMFPEDLLCTYRFVHGEVCEIPLGLARHLNNTYKKIRTIGDGDGSQRGNELPRRGLPTTFNGVSRVRFTPVDMM